MSYILIKKKNCAFADMHKNFRGKDKEITKLSASIPGLKKKNPCSFLLLLCAQSCLSLCRVAHQTPLSMGFSRQQYWSGLPFPTPGDLPDPEIKPMSLCLHIGRWVPYVWATWEALLPP